MKNFVFLLVILLSFASCKTTGNKKNIEVSIVPQPNQQQVNDGNFTVNKRTSIVIPEISSLNTLAEYLNSRFRTAAGFELKVTNEKPSKNYIAIELDSLSGMGNEAYSLNVTTKGATIKASTAHGAFYGLMSVLQLLPPEIESTTRVNEVEWLMPCLEIRDQPRFALAGIV